MGIFGKCLDFTLHTFDIMIVFIRMKKKAYSDISTYEGKWVAFIGNKPVEWENDLNLLMQKIKKRHLPKEPSIMLVPHRDEGPYILFI